MNQVLALMAEVMGRNGLITAFVVVGLTVWVSYQLSARLTRGQLHGSAIAIMLGLLAAYLGGLATGGTRGVADLEIFAGIGLMGGAMLRDFSIIATAFGVNTGELARAGVSGVISLFVGVIGAVVAYAFGYTDAVSMTTIGAGAATYIVGPVTGAAIGATSDVVALSIAAGLVKSMLVMAGTPFIAPLIGLNNPRAAMIYGGLMGTTSGVAGGLAATDERLVPYGAMTATFYTGLGCLLGPSVIFVSIRAIMG